MTTTEVVTNYIDVPQVEASKALGLAGKRIGRAVEAIEGKALAIGIELLAVRESGMAVAAYADIDSGERDYSTDGRTTAVSTFVDGIEGLNRKLAFRYMETAQRNAELEAGGIDSAQFSDSAFRSLPTDTPAGAFVDVVEAMLSDVDDNGKVPTVTAKAFTAAGRAAGIVPPAKAGGGGDTFRKAINDCLAQLAKASDRKLSKTDKAQLKTLAAKATGLLEG